MSNPALKVLWRYEILKKSLAELEAIRKKTLEQINLRTGREGFRVVVGMATCGIAAGARPVLTKIMELVEKEKLTDVTVSQTGCIGLCRLEPIVEVVDDKGEKTTYVKVNPEKAERIVEEHLKNKHVVKEYTMTVVDGTLIDPKVEEN